VSAAEGPRVRVGIGYDSHRLVAGRPLRIGLVEIPFEKGLSGHSDGDILVHALTDALLGAAGLGDIGRHFPDDDPRWKGADSRVFLEHAVLLLGELGYRPSSVDAVVILERPKLAPHVEKICACLAGVLRVPANCVSVKAKTAEGLGDVGQGHAAECHAVAVIERAGT
jgi:2-C-methyl-D-erythritol 2,4-cyclodiphosphate synthase